MVLIEAPEPEEESEVLVAAVPRGGRGALNPNQIVPSLIRQPALKPYRRVACLGASIANLCQELEAARRHVSLPPGSHL